MTPRTPHRLAGMRTGDLLKLFDERERLAAKLRAVESKLDDGIRQYSYARGYKMPLRREDARRAVANG